MHRAGAQRIAGPGSAGELSLHRASGKCAGESGGKRPNLHRLRFTDDNWQFILGRRCRMLPMAAGWPVHQAEKRATPWLFGMQQQVSGLRCSNRRPRQTPQGCEAFDLAWAPDNERIIALYRSYAPDTCTEISAAYSLGHGQERHHSVFRCLHKCHQRRLVKRWAGHCHRRRTRHGKNLECVRWNAALDVARAHRQSKRCCLFPNRKPSSNSIRGWHSDYLGCRIRSDHHKLGEQCQRYRRELVAR